MRQIIRGIVFFAAWLVVFLLLSSNDTIAETDISDPLTYYHQGVAAQNIGEREQAFEKALALYLAQFNAMQQKGQMNGLLCYNIGNCFFNLEQFGEAVFYYRLAQRLLPKNEKISANLETALLKRENPVDVKTGWVQKTVLFFHYTISTSQRLNILLGAAIFGAVSCILMIIRPHTAFIYTSAIPGIIVFFLMISIGVEYYMPNNVGIVARQTDVRRGQGERFAPMTAHPIGVGSSIRVLALENNWYLVKLNDGRKGYIPEEHLKILPI